MFFKNQIVNVYFEFFWVGLLFGLIFLLCKLATSVCRRNKYAFNLISFVYVLGAGVCYIFLCNSFFYHRFSFYGLLSMLAGIIFFSTSVDFFFTKAFQLLYNTITKHAKEEKNIGKQLSSKET